MPQRSTDDKKRLKKKAKSLIRDFPNVEIDTEETTGANEFKYKAFPEAVGVVVDLGSDRGFVQISGQEEDSSKRIQTGQEDGYTLEWFEEGQTCMLHGNPSVIFIAPAPPAPAPE